MQKFGRFFMNQLLTCINFMVTPVNGLFNKLKITAKFTPEGFFMNIKPNNIKIVLADFRRFKR